MIKLNQDISVESAHDSGGERPSFSRSSSASARNSGFSFGVNLPTNRVMRQISHIAPAGLLAAAITLVGTGLAIGDSAKSVSQALLAVAAVCFIAMAYAGAQRDHARK